jgi:hypothetical protein
MGWYWLRKSASIEVCRAASVSMMVVPLPVTSLRCHPTQKVAGSFFDTKTPA